MLLETGRLLCKKQISQDRFQRLENCATIVLALLCMSKSDLGMRMSLPALAWSMLSGWPYQDQRASHERVSPTSQKDDP